jgi:hypothetical protein
MRSYRQIAAYICLLLAGSGLCLHPLSADDGLTDSRPQGLEVMPRILVGAVSWDELRSRGGHKSIVGLDVDALYVTGRNGVSVGLQRWWVSEGLDINRGVIPKGGYKADAELRRYFTARNGLVWYWERDRVPGKWKRLSSPAVVAGAGLERGIAHVRAAVTQSFAARTDLDEDPEGRVGFDVETGMRLDRAAMGLFWRGAGFQEPDAKLIQAGAWFGWAF